MNTHSSADSRPTFERAQHTHDELLRLGRLAAFWSIMAAVTSGTTLALTLIAGVR